MRQRLRRRMAQEAASNANASLSPVMVVQINTFLSLTTPFDPGLTLLRWYSTVQYCKKQAKSRGVEPGMNPNP